MTTIRLRLLSQRKNVSSDYSVLKARPSKKYWTEAQKCVILIQSNWSVSMTVRFHLFPFRTQKLSFLTPKVLCGTPLGRIGHRRFSVALLSLKQIEGNFFILYIKTADVPMRPRFFVDSIQRDGERVWARIVIDKQAKQGMKLCEKRGTESKKVEKDREKLSKTIDKNSLE